MRRYGLALGRAFQVVDDVLDFTSSEAELGKPVGSDLRQGHLTLPVIRFAQANPQEWRDWVARIPQLLKGGDFIFGEAPEGSGKHGSTPAQDQAMRDLVERIAQFERRPPGAPARRRIRPRGASRPGGRARRPGAGHPARAGRVRSRALVLAPPTQKPPCALGARGLL